MAFFCECRVLGSMSRTLAPWWFSQILCQDINHSLLHQILWSPVKSSQSILLHWENSISIGWNFSILFQFSLFGTILSLWKNKSFYNFYLFSMQLNKNIQKVLAIWIVFLIASIFFPLLLFFLFLFCKYPQRSLPNNFFLFLFGSLSKITFQLLFFVCFLCSFFEKCEKKSIKK